MKKILLFVLAFFLSAFSLYPQKVGLVLSGGGTKGLSHIGVLKALEENDIPIDYIVGTSMGAIIGALYASGYTPGEIESIFRSGSVKYWASGEIENKYKFYFNKDDPNAAWKIFRIAYDKTFNTRMPVNLTVPYHLDYAFLEFFSGPAAASGYNFDSLYIPFRCVASDINENKALVIRKGDLSSAVRASMTFPFFYKPIWIDGKLLFDGGIYNNFPIDVLRDEFHPDVIIGSKAATNFAPPREDDVISQLQSMFMEKVNIEIDSTRDILIEPLLPSAQLIDFGPIDAFIDSGYVTTIKKMPEIMKLIKDRENNEVKQANRKFFKSRMVPVVIGNVIVNGIDEKQRSYVERFLGHVKKSSANKTKNETELTPERVKSDYFKLIADERIEYIYPRLKQNPLTQKYDLELDLKKENLFITELGGLVSSSAVNEIFLQVKYNNWRRNSFTLTGNTYIGRFYTSGQLRAKLDIPSRTPYYIEGIYTYNSFNFFRTTTYFYEDKVPSYLLQSDNFWSMNFGTPATRSGKMIAQFTTGRKRDDYYQTNIFSRLDTLDRTTFDFISPGSSFEINTLNLKQYPTSGVFLKACVRLVSGNEKTTPGSTAIEKDTTETRHDWLQFRFTYTNYFTSFRFIKVGFQADLTLSNKPFFANYTSTILSTPVYQPVPESRTLFLAYYRANNYAAFGLKFVFDLVKNVDFRLESFAFQPFREIKKTEDNTAELGLEFADRSYILSSALVYNSPLGPISLNLNYYDKAEEHLTFNFNIGYFLFNKRPFE